MGILRNCNIDNGPPTQDGRRPSSRPVDQPARADLSRIDLHGTGAIRLIFSEDFTLEHSLPSSHIALTGISGVF